MSRTKVLALVAVVALCTTSCRYVAMARSAEKSGEPVPWWCNPTEEIPVTEGPASGTVDWYAGTHKDPLPWDDCHQLSAWFDEARDYALQWPTAADAVADGWDLATAYVPGMGTHHVRNSLTPEQLNSPDFDRNDPILDDNGLDDVFDPTRPEVLQFDGNGPNARLVGFDYYVRTENGLPPEGFPGNNDWWHHHPRICFRTSDAVMIAFNASDTSCASMNGINVNMSNYYMLHVWILDDMVFTPDVYAGMMPCISGGTAIRDDATHPCHVTRDGMGAMAHGTTVDLSHETPSPHADHSG